jgi:RNA polymerase sigma factor (sigma-70 family)
MQKRSHICRYQMEAKKNTNKTKEDQLLVQQAIEGDEKAFAQLMLRYRDSIYYMMLKMSKNKNDAEDLTLEAFGKAFANLHLYSPDFAFSTWLYRIATNNGIDFLRKQRSIHFSLDQSFEQDFELSDFRLKSSNPNPEERLIIKQRAKIIRNFIGKLKPAYRRLIELRYFHEYSYDEIAKELDLPLGTIKVQLFRARNMLYDLIAATDVNE